MSTSCTFISIFLGALSNTNIFFNRSIWPIDRTLRSTPNLGESRPKSEASEMEFSIILRPPFLVGVLLFFWKHSQHILNPAPWVLISQSLMGWWGLSNITLLLNKVVIALSIKCTGYDIEYCLVLSMGFRTRWQYSLQWGGGLRTLPHTEAVSLVWQWSSSDGKAAVLKIWVV